MHRLVLAVLVAACTLVASAGARPFDVPPTITGFAPNHGAVGQKVTIYGHNLGGAQVSFNGLAATNVVVDPTNTHVTFNVPTGAEPAPTPIQVMTSGGTVMTASNFTVTPAALPQPKLKSRISSFAPMQGKVGTRIVIRGINLGGTMWVKFGGVKATYTVPSNTKIVAHVPKHAHSGRISIKTTSGISTNALRFTVLGSSGT
jgi:hypothetical protein